MRFEASSYPKQVRVLRVTGALNLSIGSDNFNFDDVIKGASPHP